MCEKCLYRKNCQFLATHKKVDVEGCTAFESEEDLRVSVKTEAYKEFAERLKEKATIPFGNLYVKRVLITDIDNLLKEMGCGE